jgi:hypothetical protein
MAQGNRRASPEARARLVAELLEAWPRKKNGAVKDGFWDAAALTLFRTGGGLTDGVALKNWWLRRPGSGRRGG